MQETPLVSEQLDTSPASYAEGTAHFFNSPSPPRQQEDAAVVTSPPSVPLALLEPPEVPVLLVAQPPVEPRPSQQPRRRSISRRVVSIDGPMVHKRRLGASRGGVEVSKQRQASIE